MQYRFGSWGLTNSVEHSCSYGACGAEGGWAVV